MLYILLLALLCVTIFIIKKYNLNIFLTFIASMLMIIMFINLQTTIDSALNGARLFFTAVFPTFFPFVLLINLIIHLDGIRLYSKMFGNLICKPLRLPKSCSIVVITSVLCGYVVGAKYTCELYKEGIISQKTAQRLLVIASNASPVFLIGSVGTLMLGYPYLGVILLISNLLSCFVMSLILSPDYKDYSKSDIHISSSNKNIGEMLSASLSDAINSSLTVGGFIVFFSVITGIIKSNVFSNIALDSPNYLISGVLSGILEMTNGIATLSNSSAPLPLVMLLISFVVAFSGICVIFQTYAFTYKHSLNMNKYVLHKIIQALVCSIITLVLVILIPTSITTISTISSTVYSSINSYLFLISAILLLLPLTRNCFNALFHAR